MKRIAYLMLGFVIVAIIVKLLLEGFRAEIMHPLAPFGHWRYGPAYDIYIPDGPCHANFGIGDLSNWGIFSCYYNLASWGIAFLVASAWVVMRRATEPTWQVSLRIANTGLLVLVTALLVVLIVRPLPGRYVPMQGSNGTIRLDTATGRLCSVTAYENRSCE